MPPCNRPHDELRVTFDPAKAREIAVAWEDGTPITINLKTCTKAELAHVAAACATALGEWDDDGQRSHCWRLYHSGLDCVTKLCRLFVDAFDQGAEFEHEPVEVIGRADAWRDFR